MISSVFIRALAVTALLTAPALAQQPAGSMQDMPGMDKPHGPADAAMQSGMQKMQQDMADAPITGDADHDFVAMMLPHHQGAVDMAKVELQYGKDPEMRKLARAIVAAQDKEIGQMRAWLARHPEKQGDGDRGR
jgi:uncharacterized protein (DUF305 family)